MNAVERESYLQRCMATGMSLEIAMEFLADAEELRAAAETDAILARITQHARAARAADAPWVEPVTGNTTGGGG